MSSPPVPVEGGPLAAALANPEALERLPVETLERLYALYREEQQAGAARAFAAALAALQGQIEPVLRDRLNPAYRSRYAGLDSVVQAVQPLLTGAGFSWSVSSGAVQDGQQEVLLLLRHAAGHTETHRAWVPAGGPVRGRDPVHDSAGRINYTARHLLCRVLAVPLVTPEDHDGNAEPEPLGQAERAELLRLVAEAQPDEARLLGWLGLTAEPPTIGAALRAGTLTAAHWPRLRTALRRKLTVRAKEGGE